MWLDLVSIAESISYTDDCDAIIWAFDGSARFLVQAVYKTISFSGGLNLLSPLVSGILLFLPRFIHIFLWLLSNNKTLTRDKLAKMKNVEDKLVFPAMNLNQLATNYLTVLWLKCAGLI